MILTEEDIALMDYSFEGNLLMLIKRKPSDFEQIKQQMLDDHDIVSNLGINPRQLIQEWKEKAKKYDSLYIPIKPSFEELQKENKQLKETLSHLIGEPNWIRNTKEFAVLHEKLDEVQMYLDAEDVPDYGYPWHIAITKILKEPQEKE